MEFINVTFDVTSQLIYNFEKVLLKLENKRYASIGIITHIFKIIEKIVDVSKQKVLEWKEELKVATTIEIQKEILDKNYYLSDALNSIFPLLRDITFSTINFINFDDYALINFIREKISYMTFFENKEILCLISASLGELNFEMSSMLFEDNVREYFTKLDVKFPEFSLHIKYPLIFKDNFLIKTAFFHEFSHLIDILLEITKNYNIDFNNYKDNIEPVLKDFINLESNQGLPKDYLEDFFFFELFKILRKWIRELITDIISVILLGPACRSLLLFWNLTSRDCSSNFSHPPFDLRNKYLSKLLEIDGYENLNEEDKAIDLTKEVYESPKRNKFKLSIEILDCEMENIISTCKSYFKLENNDLLEFLKKNNPEKDILLDLVRNDIPLGVYLPLHKNKNNKENIIKYEKIPIFKILNVFWIYYFEILFDKEKTIEQKLDLFKKIEERAKKSIDLLRGFENYEKFNK